MRVSEVMTTEVCILDPDQSIQDAAKAMRDLDIGIVPVGEDDRLVGMITDRDITVRAAAADKRPSTRIRDVMTEEVKYCFEDEDTEHVADNMAEQQLRRLPVLNRDKRLVGIVSLADLVVMEGTQPAATALAGISRPGGAHSQTD
jgi:CBS domain-containing protein